MNKDIEFCIEKLTELLIKEDFKEKQTGNVVLIKKTDCYRDVIKLLKEISRVS